MLSPSGDLLLAMGCGASQPPSQPEDEWPEGYKPEIETVSDAPPDEQLADLIKETDFQRASTCHLSWVPNPLPHS